MMYWDYLKVPSIMNYGVDSLAAKDPELRYNWTSATPTPFFGEDFLNAEKQTLTKNDKINWIPVHKYLQEQYSKFCYENDYIQEDSFLNDENFEIDPGWEIEFYPDNEYYFLVFDDNKFLTDVIVVSDLYPSSRLHWDNKETVVPQVFVVPDDKKSALNGLFTVESKDELLDVTNRLYSEQVELSPLAKLSSIKIAGHDPFNGDKDISLSGSALRTTEDSYIAPQTLPSILYNIHTRNPVIYFHSNGQSIAFDEKLKEGNIKVSKKSGKITAVAMPDETFLTLPYEQQLDYYSSLVDNKIQEIKVREDDIKMRKEPSKELLRKVDKVPSETQMVACVGQRVLGNEKAQWVILPLSNDKLIEIEQSLDEGQKPYILKSSWNAISEVVYNPLRLGDNISLKDANDLMVVYGSLSIKERMNVDIFNKVTEFRTSTLQKHYDLEFENLGQEVPNLETVVLQADKLGIVASGNCGLDDFLTDIRQDPAKKQSDIENYGLYFMMNHIDRSLPKNIQAAMCKSVNFYKMGHDVGREAKILPKDGFFIDYSNIKLSDRGRVKERAENLQSNQLSLDDIKNSKPFQEGRRNALKLFETNQFVNREKNGGR